MKSMMLQTPHGTMILSRRRIECYDNIGPVYFHPRPEDTIEDFATRALQPQNGRPEDAFKLYSWEFQKAVILLLKTLDP